HLGALRRVRALVLLVGYAVAVGVLRSTAPAEREAAPVLLVGLVRRGPVLLRDVEQVARLEPKRDDAAQRDPPAGGSLERAEVIVVDAVGLVLGVAAAGGEVERAPAAVVGELRDQRPGHVEHGDVGAVRAVTPEPLRLREGPARFERPELTEPARDAPSVDDRVVEGLRQRRIVQAVRELGVSAYRRERRRGKRWQ